MMNIEELQRVKSDYENGVLVNRITQLQVLETALSAVAPLVQCVPQGWKLVPLEPTEDMIFAMTHIRNDMDSEERYEMLRQAIIAAPNMPTDQPEPQKWPLNDSDALAHLDPNFSDTAGVLRPKEGYTPTEKDYAAIDYLFAEWDYVYEPTPLPAAPGALPAPVVQQPSQEEEILALHRKLAAETLRADQGWQRYESANADRNALRMQMVEQPSRNEVLEEAAQACDERCHDTSAAAIRAMKN